MAVRDHASDDFESDIAGDGGEHIDLWSGVKASSGLASGAYGNTVLYTVVSEAADMEGILLSSYSTNNFAGGDTLTITTPLMTSIDLTQEGWKPTVTIGSKTCEITKIGPNKDTGLIEIDCKTPAMTAGTYDVTVSFPKFGDVYQDLTAQFTYRVGGTETIASLSQTEADSGETIEDFTIYTDLDYAGDPGTITVTTDAGTCGGDWTGANEYGKLAVTCSSFTAAEVTEDTEYTFTVAAANYGTYGDEIKNDSVKLTVKNAGFVYELNFDANGGSFTLPQTQTYTGPETSHQFTVAPVNAPAITSGKSGISDWTKTDEIPYRAGYLFTGWATTSSGTATYTNSDDFNITVQSSSPTVTLYAQWAAVTDMQSMSTAACNAMKDHAVGKLADNRDNKRYRITKMKDGHCWMTQNLALGKAGEALSLNSTYSATNGSYTIAASQIQAAGTNTAWASSGTDEASANTDHIYASNDTEIGNLYNWHTATGGSGMYADYGSANSKEYSICPKNWQLPYATNSASQDYVKKMTDAEGVTSSATFGLAPYWFANTGYYNYSSGFRDNGSCWWSRTPNPYSSGKNSAYTLSTNGSQYLYAKVTGYSVRCVF